MSEAPLPTPNAERQTLRLLGGLLMIAGGLISAIVGAVILWLMSMWFLALPEPSMDENALPMVAGMLGVIPFAPAFLVFLLGQKMRAKGAAMPRYFYDR